MPEPVRVISSQSAPSWNWNEFCTAWDLVDHPDLSVVQELMPPGTAAQPHQHVRSRQFFYVLAGTGTLRVGEQELVLTAGTGAHVPARIRHHLRNDGDIDLEFIVITTPRDPGHQHVRPTPRPSSVVLGSYLRPTRARDLQAIVEIEDEESTARWLGPGGMQWHEQVLADPASEHLALVDRLNGVVAFGVLTERVEAGERSVQVIRMAVAPRGRGQGLGRVLMRHLMEHAGAHPQIERVWLIVDEANARARSLYRTFGFVEQTPPHGVLMEPHMVYLAWQVGESAPHTLGR